MQLDKAIKERISHKRFHSKKPDRRDILEAINAARYAPMAGNIFSMKFIIVEDPEKIQELKNCCQQEFVGNAHYVVVACSNPSITEKAFKEDAEKYCRQQAGAAIQNFLLKLTELKLVTCWTGLFDEGLIREALKIPDTVTIEAVFPIGYALAKEKSKRKTELENIIYFEKYGRKYLKDKYDKLTDPQGN